MTKVRSSISKKNEWFIEQERYLELLHFCRQYNVWKHKLANLTNLHSICLDQPEMHSNYHGDPTGNIVVARDKYARLISMVEKCAIEADNILSEHLIIGITEDKNYDYLDMVLNIPCCKSTYYDRYRKFFWLLDKKRD